jgi:hypothetical protein
MAEKSRLKLFFYYLKKHVFQPVYFIKNIVGTVINLLVASKNQNQPQFKNQLELGHVFSRTLKAQKHLI